MLTPEYPSPTPVVFQSSLGPSAGHAFKRPVSAEWPSRFTPRHCGQSSAASARAAKEARTRVVNKTSGRFIAGLLGWGGNDRGECRAIVPLVYREAAGNATSV